MVETMTSTIQRVSHITLIVDDQDKALKFFQDAVQAEVSTDQEFEADGQTMRWLTIRIPGDDLEWSLMTPLPMEDQGPPPVGDSNMVVLQVGDCDVATDLWAEAGGTVVSKPEDQPWGRVSVVRDPDGNPFNLVQPTR